MTALMGRYRKKPIEIIAHQIGADGWPDEIWKGVNDNRIKLHLQKTETGVAGYVEIDTREGSLRGYPGDWIIRGIQGEFYPCGNEIFAATYEPCGCEEQRSEIERLRHYYEQTAQELDHERQKNDRLEAEIERLRDALIHINWCFSYVESAAGDIRERITDALDGYLWDDSE